MVAIRGIMGEFNIYMYIHIYIYRGLKENLYYFGGLLITIIV